MNTFNTQKFIEFCEKGEDEWVKNLDWNDKYKPVVGDQERKRRRWESIQHIRTKSLHNEDFECFKQDEEKWIELTQVSKDAMLFQEMQNVINDILSVFR